MPRTSWLAAEAVVSTRGLLNHSPDRYGHARRILLLYTPKCTLVTVGRAAVCCDSPLAAARPTASLSLIGADECHLRENMA